MEDIQAPTQDGDTLRHPAWGCISISRPTSGGGQHFFGSDLKHEHHVELRVHEAYQRSDFHAFQHYAEKQILGIRMTESQWNALVSAPASYSGVPVTFSRRPGPDGNLECVPGFEVPNLRGHFQNETRKKARESTAGLRRSLDELKNLLQTEKTTISKKQLTVAVNNLDGFFERFVNSMGFIQTVLEEEVEKNLERAKVEMEAYFVRRTNELKTPALSGEHG